MMKLTRIFVRILPFLFLALLSCLLLSCESNGEPVPESEVLYVYNWGEYISDGSEGSLDVNVAFEEYCRNTLGRDVKVNYSTFSSNESMYAKLSSGSVRYDVICPSDYMLARLANEGLLAELNPNKNIPNYQYIDDSFKGLYYDPDQIWSVPYTYGTIGIIYNTELVPEEEEDLGSWKLLWNENYRGNILQFNNPRDAFATALSSLGYSLNTTEPQHWKEALDLLITQKNVVQGYVMDEVFNKMKGGSAAIAPYYAGDFFTMYADNDRLAFCYPEEGANVFVDAMCIPKNTQNYDLAVEYINFMLSEEIAIANAEYICYASPNRLVYENEEYIAYMNEELHEDAMSILYDFDMSKMEFFHDLSQVETDDGSGPVLTLMNSLWEELKIESNIGTSVYVICGIIVAAALTLGIVSFVKKKRREAYYD